MAERTIRECDQCGLVIADGARRYEFEGWVAIVNGERTDDMERSETCSPACCLAKFRALVDRVTEAEQAKGQAKDCHAIGSAA